jgi:hypothetical protein
MWDYVIDKHGRQEFEAVYRVVLKYKNDRFSEESQRKIAEEADCVLRPLGMDESSK